MGFFSRLGNKVSSLYNKGSRIGHKVLGTASRLGHKVSSVGHMVVDAVKGSPLSLVPGVATATGVADRVLGAVDKGTALADRGMKALSKADKVKSQLERGATAGLQSMDRATSSLQKR
tara:strand:- start:932 stop:1285 length:354 start_codon:yes stop_codon:yes gene_type:complete